MPYLVVLMVLPVFAIGAEASDRTGVGAGGASRPPKDAKSATVTLLTGDRVNYTEFDNGQRSFTVDPAIRVGRPPVVFQGISGPGGAFYVFPSDVGRQVASGALDRDLFNLPLLVEEGLSDDRSKSLPVIVKFAGHPSAKTVTDRTASLPATGRKLLLPGFEGAGVRVERAKSAMFWDSLSGRGQGGSRLGREVATVWLDRRVKAAGELSSPGLSNPEFSIPGLGAPGVWRGEGYDGTGVKVAVVDTGIDAEHPDLAGKVAAAWDFTGEGTADDLHGHGTHVASIVAGTGAASGGKYKGVAPGASLLNGKVLDASGSGYESWVIAGMDWAVQQGADIVNMSLGGAFTDGTDPLSQELDRLSAESGVLFVVAAGNSGHEGPFVGTPGAAMRALTVGAVDGDDQPAWFSSGGPRRGDGAVKPNLVAPGVEIVAARAGGTSLGTPVGEHYTTLSGTSMSTPHVAGAAALLAQARPQWQAAELRRSLASTSADIGATPFVQGAGRVDVARALSQGVYADASVDVGRLEPGNGTTTRTLTYTNTTDTAVTLNLGLAVKGWNGATVPQEAVRLSQTAVTVPARGDARVDLVTDPGSLGAGVYGGAVSAINADSGVRLRTPIGLYYRASQTAELTVRAIDAHGDPLPYAPVVITNDTLGLADVNNDPLIELIYFAFTGSDGVAKVRVPTGVYSALSEAYTARLNVHRFDLLTAVERSVTADTEIVLDARKGVPVTASTAESTDLRDHYVYVDRRPPSGAVVIAGAHLAGLDWPMYVTPTPAAKRGTIAQYDAWAFAQNMVTLAVHNFDQGLLHPEFDGFGVSKSRLAGKQQATVVFAGQGTPTQLASAGVQGKLALVRIAAPEGDPDSAFWEAWGAAYEAVIAAGEAGALGVVVYVDSPGALPLPDAEQISPGQLPAAAFLSLSQTEGEMLRTLTTQGPVRLDLTVRDNPSRLYYLFYYQPNGVPDALEHRPASNDQLIAIPTRIHTDRARTGDRDGRFIDIIDQWVPGTPLGPYSNVSTYLQGPVELTEYIGPVTEQAPWIHAIQQTGIDRDGRSGYRGQWHWQMFSPDQRSRPEERWFEGPMHVGNVEHQPDSPALLGDRYPFAWAEVGSCRGGADGDLFAGLGNHMADNTAGHYAGYWPYPGVVTTKARLFRADTEVPIIPPSPTGRDFPTWRMAPEPAVYRLEETDLTISYPYGPLDWHATDVFRLAPQTHTVWTFHSQRPTRKMPSGYYCATALNPSQAGDNAAFQPLIQLRYRHLDLDLANQAMAGQQYTFQITAATHAASVGDAPIAGLTVSYSVDDGKTWRTAQVTSTGANTYQVTLTHPPVDATSGFVSLRAEASDTAGNRVTQTIDRAYALATTRAG